MALAKIEVSADLKDALSCVALPGSLVDMNAHGMSGLGTEAMVDEADLGQFVPNCKIHAIEEAHGLYI